MRDEFPGDIVCNGADDRALPDAFNSKGGACAKLGEPGDYQARNATGNDMLLHDALRSGPKTDISVCPVFDH